MNGIVDFVSATVITDIAAMLLVFCVIIYTSTYRKRAYLEDKLFFALVILNMLSVFTDALNDIFEKMNVLEHGYTFFIIAGHTVFVLVNTITSLLFVLYLAAVYRREDFFRGLRIILFFPAVILFCLLIYNLFTGAVFHINELTGLYEYGTLRLSILIPVYFYVALSLIMLWKNNKPLLILVAFLILFRIIFEIVLYEISATPFVFAVCLVYCHICLMNRTFFEEVQL